MKTAERIGAIIFVLMMAFIGASLIAIASLTVYDTYRQHGLSSVPPDYVLIKGERWYIDSENGLEKTGRYAETSCERRIIHYDSDLSDAVLRESLWHEIYHAELCSKDIAVSGVFIVVNPNKEVDGILPNWKQAIDGEEHDVVYPLAMAQASFMHDNPGFVRWAMEWR